MASTPIGARGRPVSAICVPLALVGVTLNGGGWILLGIDVVTRAVDPELA